MELTPGVRTTSTTLAGWCSLSLQRHSRNDPRVGSLDHPQPCVFEVPSYECFYLTRGGDGDIAWCADHIHDAGVVMFSESATSFAK
jgi:hypothetical protein